MVSYAVSVRRDPKIESLSNVLLNFSDRHGIKPSTEDDRWDTTFPS